MVETQKNYVKCPSLLFSSLLSTSLFSPFSRDGEKQSKRPHDGILLLREKEEERVKREKKEKRGGGEGRGEDEERLRRCMQKEEGRFSKKNFCCPH